ncbi:HAD family acid phosphatase [Legionella micdadei]|uniref:Predicted secreted acid phosphatase n=1 Tax=Legionella micdadei TaxID=451 RepID=A0A098GCU2_LEGMI|nr:HAD family acid phosphatase [Legionella micdadei]ARG98064.1 acid phosphatase [Legionella micdadei]KTD30109.1 acid phosphatase, class B [Legionella micdadei]NSL18516.1 acid phosphatase [Legionella micdadei]CEG60304.1 putative acid phosphatase [Legionella micdadei]SCY56674.1 Predicted secreted acid phosphatase [Legionella micdadei]
MKKIPFRFINQVFIALSFALFTSLSFAEPLNLSILKKELEAYHDTGAYQKELACVIAQAQEYILKQAAANEQLGNRKKKLAIVLDIDETSLSNYPRMAKRHFNSDSAQVQKNLLAADAPVIKSMLSLYNNARQHHVAVFFVTGRPISMLRATRTNLLRAGYNHWAGLYFRPDSYSQPTIIPFKSQARKSITNQGYTVIASIGDQYSDLQGGYAQRGFKLPNPFYYLP